MGKASSAKKVSRAARAGGGSSSRQPRSLLFPGVVMLVLVLGVSLVVYSRDLRNSEDVGGIPQLGDHIHTAYGVSVCGTFREPIPEFESAIGVHTHGDGVMHIHPFSQLGVGANATLERFLKDARTGNPPQNVSISDTELVYGGETVTEGKTVCEGVNEPELRVAYWENVADEASQPVITTGDFGGRRLSTDGAGITIFYGDPKADIPKPPTAADLKALGAVDGAQVPTKAGETTTTVAVKAPTTTVAEGSPGTTAG